jgi:AcrR family transcriptional regulator
VATADRDTDSSRLYRGITRSQRQAQRRERLMQAGLALFGTQGYANSSIRAISRQAGLNSRYFYESFSSREDLLYQLYLSIVHELGVAVVEATADAETIEEQARAGLRASWTAMTDDRRKARIIALEVVGISDRLESARRDARYAFADILVRNAMGLADPDVKLRVDPVLNARSLMGCVTEMLVEWINGDVQASVDDIVEHLTLIFTSVTYACVQREPHAGAQAGLSRAGRAAR